MNTIWHQNPFTRIAIAFILGLLLAYYAEPSIVLERRVIGVFLVLLIAIWLARKKWRTYRYRYTFGALLSVIFMMAGFIKYGQFTRHNQLEVLPQNQLIWMGTLEEYPIPTSKSIKLELKLLGYYSEGETHVIESNIIAYAKQDSGFDTLMIGDNIIFRGAIFPFDTPLNPGQFDYGAYLQKQGVCGMAFLNKENTSTVRPHYIPFSIVQQFKKVQHQMVEIFGRYGMPQSELGVASALILGYRAKIDPSIKKEYVDAGVVHILAVSGLHVGIIYLIFQWLLSLVFKKEKWSFVKLCILLLLLWGYAGVTGFSPSVLRAATMFSFLAVGKQFLRYGSIYNMLGVSAVVLLLFDPSLLFEVGFQLSYIAVIGIALFYKPIHNLWIIESNIGDKIWSLAAVSIAAQISTFPLAIYYFHQFPLYFLLANIMIIGLATVCLYTGLAALALSWLPGVDWILLKVVEYLFFVLNYIVNWISHLPNSKLEFLFFKPITVVLLYLFIGFLYKFFQSPLKWKIWWPISIAIILTVLFTTRKISVYNTSEVTILQGTKQPITIFQYGKTAWVKTTQQPKEFLAKEQFYIDGFRNLKGIANLNVLAPEDTLILGNISWIGDTLKVLVPDTQLSKIPNTNELIVVNESVEINTTNSTLYIINPALSDYKKRRVMNAFHDAKKIPWDMESQGIFSLQLH